MTEHPPLRRIAGAFARYANLTFGGGTATVAVLNRELVAKRGWVDEQPFGLCYAAFTDYPRNKSSFVLYRDRMVAKAPARCNRDTPRGFHSMLSARNHRHHVI